jgi:hypothetical protein
VPEQGQTALIIPVPAADPILAAVATEYPDAVRPGIPAHVSLLYPFLPVGELVADDLDPVLDPVRRNGGEHTDTAGWLSVFAARTRPFEVRFTEIGTEPGFAGLTAPELVPLTTAIRARWPRIIPYGGRFGADPAAHLTIAMDFAATDAARILELTRQFLPLTIRVEELWLLALASTWHRVGRFRFTGNDNAMM